MYDLYDSIKTPADLDMEYDRVLGRVSPPDLGDESTNSFTDSSSIDSSIDWLERPGDPLGSDSDSFGYETENWGDD